MSKTGIVIVSPKDIAQGVVDLIYKWLEFPLLFGGTEW